MPAFRHTLAAPFFSCGFKLILFFLRQLQHRVKPFVINDAPLTDAVQLIEHLIFQCSVSMAEFERTVRIIKSEDFFSDYA